MVAAVFEKGDLFRPETVSWAFTSRDFGHLLEAAERAWECVIDLETTGLFEHNQQGGPLMGGYPARIVLASLTLPSGEDDDDPVTWVLPLSHPDSMWLGSWREKLKQLMAALIAGGTPVINQNVKFDARWLRAHSGHDLSGLITWCTQASSLLMDETYSAKLKERVPRDFCVERWDDFDLTKTGAAERVPLIDLGLYAARDTWWTWRLARAHRALMFLSSDGAEPESREEAEDARIGRLATWSVMPSVAALTKVEQRGMALDRDWVLQRLADNQQVTDELAEELVSRYPGMEGDPSFAPTSHWFRAWTEKAVAAGDLRVASVTRQGNAQWTKSVLLRQARHGSQVAEDLLRYRRAAKQNEFLRSWLSYCTPWGTVHSTYNVGGAATGRTSSSDPNKQQVTAELRPAWVPRRGYLIGDFDLSQIELRIAAFLSRSEPMMDAYRRGLDLHRMLAAEMARVPLEKVTPEQRQMAKAGNFGLLFCMGAAGLMSYAETAYDVVMSFEEAQRVHSAFFRTWDGIGQWHQRTIASAHQTGRVTSPLGRVRRIPEIMSGDEYLVSAAERIAVNSPVQGMASDVLLTALSLVEGTVPGYGPQGKGARAVATVHDSMVCELPEDCWKEAAQAVLDTMTHGVLAVLRRMGCEFDVPLAAEAKIGTRWGLSDVAKMEAG